MAGSQAQPVIEVRVLQDIPDFQGAVRLQQEIWGFSELDSLPVRLFIVARKIGGQSFGAFVGSDMIGFCIALPGIKHDGEGFYLHSNMLGVVAQYRNSGVGRMLKLAQREDALSRGINLMEWTFDPLEIKNAYFNMERLGAVVQRYVLNQYGVTSSKLHGGLPTDRCVAEWYLDSDRVKAALAGKPLPRPAIEAKIDVPGNIDELRHSDPRTLREVQRKVTDQFLEHFRAGLVVVGVEKHTDGGAAYLLANWKP